MAWLLVFFFIAAFQCGSRFSYLWSSAAYLASHCLESAPIALAFSTSDVVTDGLILAMPVYWVGDSPQLLVGLAHV